MYSGIGGLVWYSLEESVQVSFESDRGSFLLICFEMILNRAGSVEYRNWYYRIYLVSLNFVWWVWHMIPSSSNETDVNVAQAMLGAYSPNCAKDVMLTVALKRIMFQLRSFMPFTCFSNYSLEWINSRNVLFGVVWPRSSSVLDVPLQRRR